MPKPKRYVVRPKLTSVRGNIEYVLANTSNSKLGKLIANFYYNKKLAQKVAGLLNKTC